MVLLQNTACISAFIIYLSCSRLLHENFTWMKVMHKNKNYCFNIFHCGSAFSFSIPCHLFLPNLTMPTFHSRFFFLYFFIVLNIMHIVNLLHQYPFFLFFLLSRNWLTLFFILHILIHTISCPAISHIFSVCLFACRGPLIVSNGL